MHFIFLENSNDFTASSLNLKAIDSFQRALIHFCKELVKTQKCKFYIAAGKNDINLIKKLKVKKKN